jgi:hypothetical protein
MIAAGEARGVHHIESPAMCTLERMVNVKAVWLRRHHPAEFLAAVLTNGKGFYSKLVYSIECRHLGLGFSSPDVSRSRNHFFPEGNALCAPLFQIKGLSPLTSFTILHFMATRFIEVLPNRGVDDHVGPIPQMIVPLRGTNHILLIDGEGLAVQAESPHILEITEVKNL